MHFFPFFSTFIVQPCLALHMQLCMDLFDLTDLFIQHHLRVRALLYKCTLRVFNKRSTKLSMGKQIHPRHIPRKRIFVLKYIFANRSWHRLNCFVLLKNVNLFCNKSNVFVMYTFPSKYKCVQIRKLQFKFKWKTFNWERSNDRQGERKQNVYLNQE